MSNHDERGTSKYCPFWSCRARPGAAQNDAVASSQPEHRTGDRCVGHQRAHVSHRRWTRLRQARCCPESSRRCEKLPGPWNALEFVLTAFDKLDARADYEVLDRARDQYLSGIGQSSHAGCDVNSQPA
jgi:hypothetical protein